MEQDGSIVGGDRHSDYGYVLEMESPGFANGLVVGPERKRWVRNDATSVLPWATEKMGLAFTEKRETKDRFGGDVEQGLLSGFGNC